MACNTGESSNNPGWCYTGVQASNGGCFVQPCATAGGGTWIGQNWVGRVAPGTKPSNQVKIEMGRGILLNPSQPTLVRKRSEVPSLNEEATKSMMPMLVAVALAAAAIWYITSQK
jgi:hypothetical protein